MLSKTWFGCLQSGLIGCYNLTLVPFSGVIRFFIETSWAFHLLLRQKSVASENPIKLINSRYNHNYNSVIIKSCPILDGTQMRSETPLKRLFVFSTSVMICALN